MKVLSKEQVIKRKDVEHTKTERNVLRRIRHPFVVQLHFAFQTGAWRCCSHSLRATERYEIMLTPRHACAMTLSMHRDPQATSSTW
jgi:serine/threonine protein kinase